MQQVAIERADDLELASDYLAVAKRINRSAFPTVLFGLINLVLVFRSPAPTPYDVGLLLDALGLVGVGIYMMRSLRTVTMLLSALLLWTSALWYLFWWHGTLAIAGLFLIWKGGQEFGRWRRFRGHFNSPADPKLQEAQEIVRAAQESASKQSRSSLELYVSGDRWLALTRGPVIALLGPEQKLLLLPVRVLEIQHEGQTVVGGFCKVVICIPSRKPLHATLTPENLQRLIGWCAGAGTDAPKSSFGVTAKAVP